MVAVKKYVEGYGLMEVADPIRLPDMHCPHCGSKDGVWEEPGEGDYYQGPIRFCILCHAAWTGGDAGVTENREELEWIARAKELAG
jgi:hypothetical protein